MTLPLERRVSTTLLVIAALLLYCGPARAQEEGAVTVEADTIEYDHDGNVVKASGGVVVNWHDSRVQAGAVVVEQDRGMISADRDVVFESPDFRVSAQTLRLSIGDETGFLEDVDVQMKTGGGSFGGKRVEKLSGRRYSLREGYYTACEIVGDEAADWMLRGQEIDLELDSYGSVREGTLEVKGVPVLYLPYMVFPTKETRQSGLLTPRLGSSNQRGFIYSQPYYWALDKHRDLTVSADIETAARLGLTGEYRYTPSKSMRGRIQGSYYNENIRGVPRIDDPAFVGLDIPEDRWHVEFSHRQLLSPGLQLYADALLVSDDLYLREIDSVALGVRSRQLRRSRRYTDSRVGLAGHRSFASYGVQLSAYQNFFGRDRFTLQKPGEAWAALDGRFAGVNYQFNASAAAFERKQGADGQRLRMAAELELPLTVQGPLRSYAWAAGSGSFYRMQDSTVYGPQRGSSLDERLRDPLYQVGDNPVLGAFEAGFDARSKFARDFALSDSKWTSIRHTLEPFVRFIYSSESSSDNFPLFDRFDSIDGRSVGTWGLDSRFLMHGGETSFEYARVSLSQSYNFDERVLDDQFSDIDLAGFIRPVKPLALRTVTSYNVGASKLTGASTSISYQSGPVGFLRGERNEVAVAYRFVSRDIVANQNAGFIRDAGVESAEAMAFLGFTRTLSMGLRGRYDLESGRFIERGGGIQVESSCQCWRVDVGIIERVNPDELQFRVLVDLAGLTGFGSSATDFRTATLDEVRYGDVGFWRPGW